MYLPSAGPISLATTFGVSVDFLSSGYLDVSVRPVRFLNLWIQSRIPLARWVAPFGFPWIKDRSRLPMAFRRVPRPSSPLSAKASARCSCLLDYHCVCIIPYTYSCHQTLSHAFLPALLYIAGTQNKDFLPHKYT